MKKNINDVLKENKDLAKEIALYNKVNQNLEPLRNDSAIFVYDKKYKRYQLAFDVNFNYNQFSINNVGVKDWARVKPKIDKTGKRLKGLIKELQEKAATDPSLKDVSYLLVISGYSSNLTGDDDDRNYQISHQRAYELFKYWKNNLGIDFNRKEYENIVDLHIAGNGIGGVGRIGNLEYGKQAASKIAQDVERQNQMFVINIIPKIEDQSSRSVKKRREKTIKKDTAQLNNPAMIFPVTENHINKRFMRIIALKAVRNEVVDLEREFILEGDTIFRWKQGAMYKYGFVLPEPIFEAKKVRLGLIEKYGLKESLNDVKIVTVE